MTRDYPDKAVVKEEAHEGGAHGAVVPDDPFGDVTHRRLSLRARWAVEVVLQRRLSKRRRAHQRSSHERHEQHGLACWCRHRHALFRQLSLLYSLTGLQAFQQKACKDIETKLSSYRSTERDGRARNVWWWPWCATWGYLKIIHATKREFNASFS